VGGDDVSTRGKVPSQRASIAVSRREWDGGKHAGETHDMAAEAAMRSKAGEQRHETASLGKTGCSYRV